MNSKRKKEKKESNTKRKREKWEWDGKKEGFKEKETKRHLYCRNCRSETENVNEKKNKWRKRKTVWNIKRWKNIKVTNLEIVKKI